MKTNSGLLSSIRLGFELVKRETELKLVFQNCLSTDHEKKSRKKKPQLIFDLVANLIDPLASTNAN